MAATLQDFLNATLAEYTDVLFDQVFNASVYLTWIKDTKRVTARPIAGKKLQVNLIKGTNSTFDFKGPWDPVTVAPEEYTKIALYDWSFMSGSISIDNFSLSLNRNSKYQVFDLMKAQLSVAEGSLANKLNTTLHGLNNATPAKPLGLQDIVSNTVAIGGIDPSVDTWWKAYIDATGGALSLTALNRAYLNVSQPYGANATDAGSKETAKEGLAVEPELEITTSNLWLSYHSLLTPQLRIDFRSKVGRHGFSALQHMSAFVLWENAVPNGYWYFLNPRYLEFVFGLNGEGKAFTSSGFKKVPLQNVLVNEIYLTIAHITNNRRYQGLLTGLT